MQTRLTELLQIEHPVMLAGMGGVSYHELAAAVSNAGGIGTLGAAPLSPEEMAFEIGQLANLTDKPFGVDLLAALPDSLTRGVDLIIQGGAALFVAGLGVPRDILGQLHEAGVLVASMCGKVRHAVSAVESGVDFVIVQGTEAGGHTGLIATLPLIPQVVDAVGDRVPVVAAGGIYDGRGLAASLALGADGVWMGTRFIATPEARTVRGYKDALLRAREDDTVISKGYSGKPMRVVRNEWTNQVESDPSVLKPFPEMMLHSLQNGVLHLGGDENTEVDINRECYPAGQLVGAIDELTPAGDLVRSVVAEAERTLDRLTAFRR